MPFVPYYLFSIFQLVKNGIWRSGGPRVDHFTGFLPSIVLDKSNEHQKSYRDNRFVYRFVRQDMPSSNLNASDGDSLIPAASPAKDIDCTLRIGDYVVHLIPQVFRLVHNLILLEFTSFAKHR